VSAATEQGLLHLAARLAAEERYDDAVVCFGAALEMNPANARGFAALGRVLYIQRKLEEAEACYRRALKLEPGNAWFHSNLGSLLLLEGRFDECWSELEYLWDTERIRAAGPSFEQPRWDGSCLAGRTLLLRALAGGFGDNIMWARYIPYAARRAGQVVLQCPPELVRLFGRIPGVAQVVPLGEPLPPFDAHAALTSLAHLLEMPDPRATGVPYLTPEPADVERWASTVAPSQGLRVGLAWATAPDHPGAQGRSIDPCLLGPITELSATTFWSLQKGAAAAGLMTPELADFADTAALLTQLDLVISADTAVAHLAGALRRPVWLLLEARADARWLLGRDDCPWYPSARLFRQDRQGNWAPVIGRVREELVRLRNCRDHS
jgi:hypothetical protein